ncbi:MAG: hypothetical protein DRR42_12065 [Gammaproteobacteria bacterium]|nr:MAG: hypothetical protein DRR42_12065 [Gammaproteobacteria bacterium]
MTINRQILIAVICVGASQFAFGQSCGTYRFPDRSNSLGTAIYGSLAKVYADAAGRQYMGTATVIDVTRGLLITASHVSKYGDAYVVFPHLGDDKLRKAIAVKRVPQANGTEELEGDSWNRVRDILILKLAEDTPGIRSVEIWPEELDLRDREFTFFGFNGNSKTAIKGEANASIPSPQKAGLTAECTLEFRENVEAGDSGAPVFDNRGLLVGVVIQQKNEHRSGRYVPAYCFQHLVMDAIDDPAIDSDDGSTKNLASKFKNSNLGLLKQKLQSQPYPRSGNEISNIELSALLRAASSNDNYIRMLDSRHDCPLRQAIIHRGIDYDLYEGYLYARMRLAGNSLRDEADQIASFSMTDRTDIGVYSRMDATAAKLYRAYIANQLNPPAVNRKATIHEARFPVGAGSATSLGTVFKSLADVEYRIAQYAVDPSPHIQEAKSAGAVAALLSTQGPTRGSAMATIGDAYLITANKTHREQDYFRARAGYSAALAEGFDQKWVKENYKATYLTQYNTASAEALDNYTPPEQFQKLLADELDENSVRDKLVEIVEQSQVYTFVPLN